MHPYRGFPFIIVAVRIRAVFGTFTFGLCDFGAVELGGIMAMGVGPGHAQNNKI